MSTEPLLIVCPNCTTANRVPRDKLASDGKCGRCSGALFTGIVGTLGARFVWENGMHHAVFTSLGIDVGDVPEGPTTPDLEWPTWIVYSAVPLGSYLMCFRFLQVTLSFVRTGELPHHDHGHVEGLDEEGPPKPGEEDIIYSMEDNLHPADLRNGSDRRENGAGTAAPEIERRSAIERRKHGRRKDGGDAQ